MIDSNGEIVLPIRLNLEEMQQDLDRAEKLARSSGASTANAYTERASGGLTKLTGAMAAFRREQSQEARTARYFVQEFAAFIPVGSRAHDVVLSLTGALAGGLGLGVAIEAVTLGIKWYTDSLREAERAAAENAKQQAEAARITAEAWQQALEAVSRERAIAAGVSEAVYDAELAADQKIAEAGARLLEAETKRSAALLRIKENEATAYRSSSASIILAAKGEVEQLDRDIAELMETLAMLAEAGASTVERTRKANAAKASPPPSAAPSRPSSEWDRDPFEASARFLEAQQEARAKGQAGLDAAARKHEREAQAEQLRAQQDFIRMQLAGWDEATFQRLSQIDNEEAQKLERLQEWFDAGLIAEEAFQAQRTDITNRAAEERIHVTRKESETITALQEFANSALVESLNVVGNELEKQLNTSRRYEEALRATGKAEKASVQERRNAIYAELQAILASMARQAMFRSMWEMAEGVAALLVPGKQAEATGHFTAAAMFAGIAVAAGAGAAAIGNNRGMTFDERRSVEDQRERARESESASAREMGAGASGGGGVVREIVIMVGDPFETPQETARRAARRLQLAHDLNMTTGLRAEG